MKWMRNVLRKGMRMAKRIISMMFRRISFRKPDGRHVIKREITCGNVYIVGKRKNTHLPEPTISREEFDRLMKRLEKYEQ